MTAHKNSEKPKFRETFASKKNWKEKYGEPEKKGFHDAFIFGQNIHWTRLQVLPNQK
jgi:hypothetical protein